MKQETIDMVLKFRDDRNWKQFHNPKDLAISISLEAAELLEIFQWSANDLCCENKKDKIANVDALEFLADVCNGDARAALTAIELGILTTERSADGQIHITIDVASECIQKRVISYT